MRKVTFASLFLLMMVLLSSCGSTNSLTKAERAAALAQQVQEALEARHYTIAVDWMKPLGGVPRQVNSDYELKVNGEELDCYLPYIGRAYRLPYGGGKGLNFKAPIQDYSIHQLTSNRSQIEFTVRNDEDVYLFRIDVFDNGKSIIDIMAQDRDAISFDGEMIFPRN